MGEYATERLIGDVLALADSMEMVTFDLVGHDWGGMLAWIVASRHPERVRSLSVVSTPHPLALQHSLLGGDPAQASYGEGMEAFRAPEVPERLLLGADGSGRGLATLLAETGLDDEDAKMYVLALTEPGALTAALNWYRAMDNTALVGLGPVTVPTLYVWSTGDEAFGRTAAEDTAACVHGPYTFEILENVSHWIPEMAPVELSAPPDPPSLGPLTVPDQGQRPTSAACENGTVNASTFALTDVQREFRDTLRTFCEDKVAPHAAEVDRNAEFPWKSFEACKEMQLPALGIPEAYGGAGADTVTQAIAVEELSRVCASTSLTILISKLGMLPVMNWGSEELKRAYMPRVATGEIQASYCLSEADAGSDVASMRTRAVRDGDDYVLTGSKYWITNAGISDVYIVFAKTDPDAGGRGISCFLVEKEWGIRDRQARGQAGHAGKPHRRGRARRGPRPRVAPHR